MQLAFDDGEGPHVGDPTRRSKAISQTEPAVQYTNLAWSAGGDLKVHAANDVLVRDGMENFDKVSI